MVKYVDIIAKKNGKYIRVGIIGKNKYNIPFYRALDEYEERIGKCITMPISFLNSSEDVDYGIIENLTEIPILDDRWLENVESLLIAMYCSNIKEIDNVDSINLGEVVEF